MVLVWSEEAREAVGSGRFVGALESTIIAHGLPCPRNLQVAREFEEAVRQEGAVPATIAVLDGRPRTGLDEEQLERIAGEDGLRQLGHRDLPLAVAAGASGATTVSATASPPRSPSAVGRGSRRGAGGSAPSEPEAGDTRRVRRRGLPWCSSPRSALSVVCEPEAGDFCRVRA